MSDFCIYRQRWVNTAIQVTVKEGIVRVKASCEKGDRRDQGQSHSTSIEDPKLVNTVIHNYKEIPRAHTSGYVNRVAKTGGMPISLTAKYGSGDITDRHA
jgi:hypothetical protein